MSNEPDWDRVQKALDKKRDEEAAREAEEAKQQMPEEIRELLDKLGATPVLPSEIAANPTLAALDKMASAEIAFEELHDHYRSALVMLHAVVKTYGVEVAPGRYSIYVSDEIMASAPDCISVNAPHDELCGGHEIHVFPHACESKANPN